MVNKAMQAEVRERLCSIAAGEFGEDPGGTASPLDLCLLIEVSKPWSVEIMESKGFPVGVSESLARLANSDENIKLMAMEPDADYSVEGLTRVILYSKPDGLFSRYDKSEFVVPNGRVEQLVDVLLKRCSSDIKVLEEYRRETSNIRDIFVCTHGAYDSCCGTFGYPVYSALRQDYAPGLNGNLRVWQVSHIGGHRFAPNLLDMPEGRNWVRINGESLENLVYRRGEVSELRGNYRGSIGLVGPHVQLAEREVFMREGWSWTERRIKGHVERLMEDGRSAEVHLEFLDPESGVTGAYGATVTHSGIVHKANCLAEPDEIDQYLTSELMVKA